MLPVHIITGFLGSGKTTLIQELIEQKPDHEKWVIVVNEFGRVGIDQAMFVHRDDVVIKGLPGGCLCCQLAFVLQVSLVEVIRRHQPDRLIIEPSGLGHPAGLLELLMGETFRMVLDVQDVIALMDPRRLDDARSQKSATFHDQIEMADAVVLTMFDMATDQQLAMARQYLEQLWPRRKWVAETSRGRLPIHLLLNSQSSGKYPPSGPGHADARSIPPQHRHAPLIMLDEMEAVQPTPENPVCEISRGLEHVSLGIRFHRSLHWDLDHLVNYFAGLSGVRRIKAVLHTADGWQIYNWSEGLARLGPTSWRQDSRIELIAESGETICQQTILAQVQACQIT
ncbi:GTP-binding protein [Halomonas sp. Bachu 37]|uniref:CobW family GTP-binding protein n=1 Tax=Halomonas kashgarensis TaxID=3084920 RepID=UPI003216C1B6